MPNNDDAKEIVYVMLAVFIMGVALVLGGLAINNPAISWTGVGTGIFALAFILAFGFAVRP